MAKPFSISLDPVSDDNIVNASEQAAGIPVTGETTGYAEGDTVTVDVFDSDDNFLAEYTGQVQHDGSWGVQVPAADALQEPDGKYRVEASISEGTHHSSDHEKVTLDTTPPTLTIRPVTSDNVVSPQEDANGFNIKGTADGANGQTVTVEIVDPLTSDIITTETATIHGGHWKVHIDQDLLTPNHHYTVEATTTDKAGNVGTADHDFDTSCFMVGTLIRTPDGEVAIETLKRGDFVLTSDGRAVAVSWIGRQTVSTLFADPLRVLPIRIKAGALGENQPARDLLLSPDHALLIDEVLIQAGALVNGTSIAREADVPPTFVYYHVELDDHSLILAENTPAETFVDNVDRMAFDNWEEHEALYPDGRAIVEMAYPRAKAHRQVPTAIRKRLAERCTALDGTQVASAA